MGEYFLIANLTKREYLDPGRCGYSLNASCFIHSPAMALLGVLLCPRDVSVLGGCGHPSAERRVAGSWCGDAVRIVGDYEANCVEEVRTGDWTDADFRGQPENWYWHLKYHGQEMTSAVLWEVFGPEAGTVVAEPWMRLVDRLREDYLLLTRNGEQPDETTARFWAGLPPAVRARMLRPRGQK